MSQDLVMKLSIENKELKQKLQESKSQIKNFKSTTEANGASISKVFSGIAKGAGAIGLAFGGVSSAVTVFNKTIESSETFSDNYQRSMSALQSVTDSFFISISNGSFQGFFDGLQGVIDKAKEAYDAMDNLGTFKTFQAVDLAKNTADRAEQQKIIKDTQSTVQQKEEAQKRLIKLQGDYTSLLKEEYDLQLKAGRAKAREVLANQGFKGDINDKELNALMSVKGQQANAKRYEELKSIVDAGTKLEIVGYGDNVRTITTYTKEAKSILDSSTYALSKAFYEGESGIAEAANYFSTAANVLASIFNAQKTDNKYLKGFEDKDTLSKNGKWEANPYNKWQRDPLAAMRENIDKAKPLEIPAIIMPKKGSLLTQKTDSKEISNYLEIKGLDDNISAIQSINSLLSQTQGLLTSQGNDWAAWGIGAVSNIISVIGELSSLYAAQLANGIASQSKLLFPFNIAAMTATAGAVISTVASIPKFATGGIVGGSQFYGDNVIARVNSGEMILNSGQQSNLFKMLNNGTSTSNNANVSFEIKGDKLVGVLNNYNNKRKKVR